MKDTKFKYCRSFFAFFNDTEDEEQLRCNLYKFKQEVLRVFQQYTRLQEEIGMIRAEEAENFLKITLDSAFLW